MIALPARDNLQSLPPLRHTASSSSSPRMPRRSTRRSRRARPSNGRAPVSSEPWSLVSAASCRTPSRGASART